MSGYLLFDFLVPNSTLSLIFAFSLAAGDEMHMGVETIVDLKQETESSQILRHGICASRLTSYLNLLQHFSPYMYIMVNCKGRLLK